MAQLSLLAATDACRAGEGSKNGAILLRVSSELHHFRCVTVQTSFASFFKIPTESTDIARQIAMNSTTSIRRSPPSYLATNDWGLVSLVARSCCVRPARFLASIIRLQNAVCPAEWTDLPSLRPREAIGAGRSDVRIIPKRD